MDYQIFKVSQYRRGWVYYFGIANCYQMALLHFEFTHAFYWHFSDLEKVELAIHIHDRLPTVKLPLAFSVDEAFKGDPF